MWGAQAKYPRAAPTMRTVRVCSVSLQAHSSRITRAEYEPRKYLPSTILLLTLDMPRIIGVALPTKKSGEPSRGRVASRRPASPRQEQHEARQWGRRARAP